jgi:hypothetical protein
VKSVEKENIYLPFAGSVILKPSVLISIPYLFRDIE